MVIPNKKGLVVCPNCKKEYKPKLTRKTNNLIQVEFPQATSEEREQLISGLCCNLCFNQFIGVEL